jgi:hypothetical protein
LRLAYSRSTAVCTVSEPSTPSMCASQKRRSPVQALVCSSCCGSTLLQTAVDGGFADYLVIGHTDGVSILAGKEAWETNDSDDPVFELVDHKRDLTYAVQEIPTPLQAQEMLQEHGQPLGEGEV